MHVSSPICTRLGFTEAGIERANCHHSPVSSGNCLGGKPCADTTFIGSVSPIAIAAIAKKSLVFFTVSSSLSISSLRGLALYRLSLIMRVLLPGEAHMLEVAPGQYVRPRITKRDDVNGHFQMRLTSSL